MEFISKKKTKNLITLKTNNFIQNQTQKNLFFQQLLTTLKSDLNPEQFNFLTSYLFIEQNTFLKKPKTQLNSLSQRKILTQPDQRIFNINDIDPAIFQQSTNQKTFIPIQKFKRSQNDSTNMKRTNTPRKRIKQIVFENKRILDLDKKLTQKYRQCNSNRQKSKQLTKGNFFIPKFQAILSSKRNNTQSDNQLVKMSFKNFTKKLKNPKIDIRRLKTSCDSRDHEQIIKSQKFQLSKFRKSEFDLNQFKLGRNTPKSQSRTLKIRRSESSVPKQLMDPIIFSRRDNIKKNPICEMYDFKLSPSYRQCFS